MIEAEFTALLSTLVAGRMFPNSVPQRTRGATAITRPLIVYHSEGTRPEYVMTGATGQLKSNLEFECQAETYLAAKELAQDVFDTIKNLGRTQLGSHDIQTCFAAIDADEFTPGVSGQETGIHSVNVTAELTYT